MVSSVWTFSDYGGVCSMGCARFVYGMSWIRQRFQIRAPCRGHWLGFKTHVLKIIAQKCTQHHRVDRSPVPQGPSTNIMRILDFHIGDYKLKWFGPSTHFFKYLDLLGLRPSALAAVIQAIGSLDICKNLHVLGPK